MRLEFLELPVIIIEVALPFTKNVLFADVFDFQAEPPSLIWGSPDVLGPKFPEHLYGADWSDHIICKLIQRNCHFPNYCQYYCIA